VVTVQCDYRTVSHSIGIVGVIFKVSKFGGARIATIAGMLSTGTRKGPWWIPANQYIMRFGKKRKPTLLHNRRRYVKQYLRGRTTSMTVHQNAQFNRRTNKSHKPLVHAGNLNVSVKGELAKHCIVAASRKTSSVPARTLATEIVGRIQTTVNELSLLCIQLILVINIL
jgi:hypothetical protein